ncbi:MAG: type I methionyl aminopeptidase [Nitrospirota bacterium]
MIILKSQQEIDKIKRACRIVAEAFDGIKKMVNPGVSTSELNRYAEEFITKKGGKPAFKGYRGYPATLCTSINEGVVHGIPSSRRLREGDIISLDLGVLLDGYYGDAAITLPVGNIRGDAKRLLRVTEDVLYKGIGIARIGNSVSDISYAIQSYVEDAGYSVVTNFVGHGIGRELHEEPQVPNFGKPGQGPRLRRGMVLAIEPMVNMRESHVEVLEDKWTVVTKDGSLSAHFEHTIVITGDEPLILTGSE